MASRKYRSLVPVAEQRIEILWLYDPPHAHFAPTPNDIKPTEHWWAAEVKSIVLCVELGYLAYAKILYDPYKDYEESVSVVHFFPGHCVALERRPKSYMQWRYEEEPKSNGMDWTPAGDSAPKLPATLVPPAPFPDLKPLLERLSKLESTVLSHGPQIDSLSDTVMIHQLELRNVDKRRGRFTELENLLSLLRSKLGAACRVLKSKAPKTERFLAPSSSSHSASQAITSQRSSEGSDETIGTVTRGTTTVEVDCTSTLFEALAKKIHAAYVATPSSTSADVEFYPSFREICDHATRMDYFAIYVPSLFHIAASIGFTKETDLELLFLKTNERKRASAGSSKKPNPSAPVSILRVAGTYVYAREDVLRPAFIVLGGSYPRTSSPEHYNNEIIARPQRPLLSFSRITREWDHVGGFYRNPLVSQRIKPPPRALYAPPNTKPVRLERFYFSWKPLPANSSEFSADMTANNLQHGKLVVNCPHILLHSEDACEEFLQLWGSEPSSIIARARLLL